MELDIYGAVMGVIALVTAAFVVIKAIYAHYDTKKHTELEAKFKEHSVYHDKIGKDTSDRIDELAEIDYVDKEIAIIKSMIDKLEHRHSYDTEKYEKEKKEIFDMIHKNRELFEAYKDSDRERHEHITTMLMETIIRLKEMT